MLLSQSLMLAAMLASATAFGGSMEPPKPFRGVLPLKGPLSSAGQGATLSALPRNVPEVRTAVPISPKRKVELGIVLSKHEKDIYLAQLNSGYLSKTFNQQRLLGVVLASIITSIVVATSLEAKYLAQKEESDPRIEVVRLRRSRVSTSSTRNEVRPCSCLCTFASLTCEV